MLQDSGERREFSSGSVRDTAIGKCDRKKDKLYGVWRSMRQRCNNQNNKDYKHYGGRGISICAEWSDYLIFKKWSIDNGYVEGLTLDRVNNNGNYEPTNCRWTTNKQQARNKNTNIRIKTEEGSPGKMLVDLSIEHNVNYRTMYDRFKSKTFDKSRMFESGSTMNVPVIRDDGKEFGSITEAARSVNGSTGKVVMVCQGKRNKHKGFSFKYKEARR